MSGRGPWFLAVEAALMDRWRELHKYADESDGSGEHVGFARHYRAKADGVWDALEIARKVADSHSLGDTA